MGVIAFSVILICGSAIAIGWMVSYDPSIEEIRQEVRDNLHNKDKKRIAQDWCTSGMTRGEDCVKWGNS